MIPATSHHSDLCVPVIEHGVAIVNIKEEQKEIWNVIRDMGKMANRIYISVLVVMLTVLVNIIFLG